MYQVARRFAHRCGGNLLRRHPESRARRAGTVGHRGRRRRPRHGPNRDGSTPCLRNAAPGGIALEPAVAVGLDACLEAGFRAESGHQCGYPTARGAVAHSEMTRDGLVGHAGSEQVQDPAVLS
jgi:hypothetical protein